MSLLRVHPPQKLVWRMSSKIIRKHSSIVEVVIPVCARLRFIDAVQLSLTLGQCDDEPGRSLELKNPPVEV